MCSIDAYEREHQQYNCDDVSSNGECPLPITSTIKALKLLGATIAFIGCGLKALEHNCLDGCYLCTNFMEKLFKKIRV